MVFAFKDVFTFILHGRVCLYVNRCPTCVSDVCRSHKKVLDPQKLELHVVVSPHEGSGY